MEHCVCGHEKASHYPGICRLCMDRVNELGQLGEVNVNSLVKLFHTFKLDNLKLIEDLAKERNLI